MPTRSTIENALRDPKRFAPAIDRLGGGRVATDRDGNLFCLGGANALVFRLDRPTGQSIALRIPLADDGDPPALGVHAAFAVDPVISELRSRTPSPVAGGVSVIPRGLLLPARRGDPTPFPAIAMEWVGDFTLQDVVRRLVGQNDVVRISGLGTQFQRLVQGLAESRFSHGDLAPENTVLRRGDAMTVVDYDSAAWPGSPRGRFGNASGAYRHPSGSLPVVVQRRDDFAALVILVTLRALAIDPGLLLPPSDHTDHGMVLSARDLQDPPTSERFRRLAAIDDAETIALSGILAEACAQSVDQTPPFEEAVRAAKAAAGRARRATGETPSRHIYPPPDEPAPDRLSARDRQLRLTRLNAMLLTGHDREALEFWDNSGLSNDPVALAASEGLIQEARDRLTGKKPDPPPPPPPEPPAYDPRREWRVISTGASMARLEQAIARGDREAVLGEWPEVQGTPGASRYVAVVHQFATDYWSGAIKQAARRDDAAGVLEAVAGADASGVPIPAGLRPLIREARWRVEGTTGASKEEAISWEQQHPVLARALKQDDDRLIAMVIDEHRDDDYRDLPAQERARVELALRRIRWAEEVRMALRRRNLAQLDRLAQQPPPGAEQALSSVERARIARIRERREAQAQLGEALRGHSNRAFVQAMRRMELCAAPLPDDLDTQAFNEALDRITRLTALRRAVTDPEADARTIARLVPAAMTGGVNWETVEKMVDVHEVERELVRSARVTRIREALALGDIEAIAAAAMPDPHDVLRELTPEERERVEAAMKAAKPLAGRKSAMSLPETRFRNRQAGSDEAEPERGDEIIG
jgi:hypothetical protein